MATVADSSAFSMRLLLIDDDPHIVRLAGYSLSASGFDVITAGSAIEGLRRAASEPIDAVLLDVMMPELDGRAVFAALRAAEATRDLPVIFFTGKSQPDVIESLLLLGARGVIRKPFVPSRLADDVREILGKPAARPHSADVPQEMRRAFLLSMGEQLEAIERSLEMLQRQPEREPLRAVAAHFHRLAGAAASYGLERVSDAAQQVEEECDALVSNDELPRVELLQPWRELVHEIRAQLAAAGADAARTTRRVIHLFCIDGDPSTQTSLHVLGADSSIAVELTSSVEGANEYLQANVPDVLLVAADLPNGSAFDILERFRKSPQGQRAGVLVIVRGRPGDEVIRQSVMHSVDDLITDPTNIESTFGKIRAVIDRKFGPSPRILSIGVEKHAESFASVIESAGYRLCAGEAIESDLEIFDPDLILAGVGDDPAAALALTRAIRLRTDPLAAPIVLIAPPQHGDLPLHAARAGAVDLLRLPISRALLLGTIQNRVQAARAHKMIVNRDPLTGCLREATFRERLQRRISEFRVSIPLLLAVIEIDGLPPSSAERITLSLADLLRRRLRETDDIARIGTKTFAIALERIDAQNAATLFARLQEEFTDATGEAFRVVIAQQGSGNAGEWMRRALSALQRSDATPRLAREPSHSSSAPAKHAAGQMSSA